MENIKHIFGALAQRLRNENDLSDFTWAFCEASPLFKKLFVSFFFEELEHATCEIYLTREYTRGNNRVDFFFTYEGENYIIENKIYDRNQHFKQYDTAYQVTPEHFGYIMNYNSFEFYTSGNSSHAYYKKDFVKQGYMIKTWDEFYDFLVEYIEQNEENNDNDVITCYLEYLRSVCDIVRIKRPMNLSALQALPAFRELLDKKVFNFENEDFATEVYINGKETKYGGNDEYSHVEDFVFGRYFEVEFLNFKRNKKNYGWLGIYFNDPNKEPCICISFDNYRYWGQPVFKLLTPYLDDDDFDWYEDNDCVWYEMASEDFELLNNATTINEQVAILQNFLNEALQSIVDVYNKDADQ